MSTDEEGKMVIAKPTVAKQVITRKAVIHKQRTLDTVSTYVLIVQKS